MLDFQVNIGLWFSPSKKYLSFIGKRRRSKCNQRLFYFLICLFKEPVYILVTVRSGYVT